MSFTVQDILNARPNLSFDGTLSGDTVLTRDNEGYAVKLSGYYEINELLAIASEIKNLNAVFAERPEETEYNVIGENGSILATKPTKPEAEKEAYRLADEDGKYAETGETYDVKPAR